MNRPWVVVIGDSLLDVDIDGTVERICPDAPVPVLDQHRLTERPGGAALAAVLATRHGAAVRLITAIGHDEAGERLRALVAEAGVELVDVASSGTTPEKVRLRADGHSVVRLDRGGPVLVGDALPGAAVDALGAGRPQRCDAVLVSDYGQGLSARADLRRLLTGATAPLVWDPHPRGAAPIPGATAVTPNRQELVQATGATTAAADPGAAGLAATARRARQLVRTWQVGAVVVTMGSDGAMLVRAEGTPYVVPARPADTGDPCGAGDCFAATLATQLGAGALVTEAVDMATEAATTFVAAGGAAAVGGTGEASGSPERAATAQAGSAPEVLVATGGCFDILHAGHVSLLETARTLGDRLVVLLNSDRSVRRLKGPERPLQPASDRRRVLLALGCVDDVVVFDEDTPLAALDRLRPDVFVKGGDYVGTDLPEAPLLERWGGQAVAVPYLSGRSTTRLVEEARRGV